MNSLEGGFDLGVSSVTKWLVVTTVEHCGIEGPIPSIILYASN